MRRAFKSFLMLAVAVVAALPMGAGDLDASGPTPDHRITVRIEPAERRIEITDRLRFAGQGDVTFRLSKAFTAAGLRVDGNDVALQRSGDNWRVALGRAGDHDLVFNYKATLQPLPENAHGIIFVTPMAGVEGMFIPESVAWVPRPDEAPFGYRIALDAPAGHKALVSGRLVAEEETNGRYRATFVSETPADGLALFAGPYAVDQRRHGDITLRTYFHPEIANLADAYLDDAARYLDLYGRWIGAYPYSAFHIVSSPLPVGYGYPNLTYIGTRVLKLPFIRRTSLGHEVLHNWWGNGVAVDFAQGNWSEGLTTYMADYTFALQRSPVEAMEMRLGWLRDYAALPPAERDLPAAAFVGKSHTAQQVIGYDKVAFLFHMLRNDIGSAAFDAAIRAFWRDNKHRAATWGDLRRAFETASGRNLKAFFQQWLQRPGAPTLRLGPVKVEETEKGFRTSFSLSQDAPTYALKVPMELTTADALTWFHATLADPRIEVSIESQERPLALAIDPEFDLFRHLDPAETPPILRDVTFAAGTLVVVAAADDGARTAARALALRLLGTSPHFVDAPPAGGAEPLLVVGTDSEVTAALAAASLPPTPPALAGRGTARVWAARGGDRALAVVMASSRIALEALARPLPHYGRLGYLVFDGAKVVERGSWPAGTGPLRVRLD